MRIKPILFNTEMVRAILDDRKTVTRRLIKPQPPNAITKIIYNPSLYFGISWNDGDKRERANAPYEPNDILYVRETWQRNPLENDVEDWDIPENDKKYLYKADFDRGTSLDGHWKPSIHMPKEAARIWLKVTDVRVERLQDITELQAEKEGAKGLYITQGSKYCTIRTKKDDFAKIWNSTIKKKDILLYGWEANPWVWVIEFERTVKPNEH